MVVVVCFVGEGGEGNERKVSEEEEEGGSRLEREREGTLKVFFCCVVEIFVPLLNSQRSTHLHFAQRP